MDSNAAAPTLTRQRVSVTVLSLAATATLVYFTYRIFNPERDPDRHLHRSNAVRHRRRSLPHTARARGHESQPSDTSDTSAESRALDENVDHNTVRPLNDGETVADEHGIEENWFDNEDNHFAHQQQRAGQNIVSLLFRVSEDNARRNAYVHRGCLCNGCGLTPIRGIRYRCANCADFDLCETCESQGLHTKTHVFYKIRIPAPRLGSRSLQPVWYPGDPENCLRLLPKHLMARLSKETGFERPELEALWEQWTFMANTEWREDPDELYLAMDRKTFERYLIPSGGSSHITPNLLHDRMFAFYDDNHDDLIGFSEFLRGTAYRKRKDRLRKIFEGYDIDGDGYVSRKDFLRLFRAYYVVFKQMHRDVLEGLADQAMSYNEVEQLVTSRQPLSSFFGREGGFNSGDSDRPLEGKVTIGTAGDVHISGGSGVVKEDSPDTIDRQSLLLSLFTRQRQTRYTHESPFLAVIDGSRGGERSAMEYLQSLFNPPTRVNELPALLLGETPSGPDVLIIINTGNDQGADNQGDRDAGNGSDNSSRRGDNGSGSNHRARSYSSSSAEDDDDHRKTVSSHRSARRARVEARRRLLERWRRRQFYLDEEEGMGPPENWSDSEDIMNRMHMNDEFEDSKSSQPPITPRSRSSSKVRFVEDTDDFDIRSNPSTSSRSIPERWGGMEISDAERDVGKEIFYQVMQQAFDEILDVLFKEKEDLAIEAAKTKALRDMYRPQFESIDIKEEKESTTPEEKDPREETLEELLARTGYTIDPPTQQSQDSIDAPQEDHNEDDGEYSDTDEPTTSESSTENAPYRDPTMPQFRPNSVSDITPQSPNRHKSSKTPANPSRSSKKVSTSKANAEDSKQPALPEPIPRSTLVYWKRLDLAEQEAKERGGWGRLDYAEFENIYRKQEAKGSRMDFLGTWIDFCIPHN
ncbi:putative calcium ion binding protein [Thermochaetoides thermophila DSM 1495]|uniref:Putative calcium ion binding protein n=1 Tax=Chaetomium thermophilum (strain DSM 1495 / CBS 144.50 / IMI 039719) TaxID=759272 RepID=G0SCY4_CHATD|nr:putative calcium ion binding protein [Thermochaetoides thermophila DSM 1495]EGS19255.1 putative calcium ion binding protein [Thermochaetoides thermophila DSM 1495]